MGSSARLYSIHDLQSTDGIKCIQERLVRAVGNEVVDTTITNQLGGLGSGVFQARIAGEVAMKNVNILTVVKLSRYLLLSFGSVAHKPYDQVLWIF